MGVCLAIQELLLPLFQKTLVKVTSDDCSLLSFTSKQRAQLRNLTQLELLILENLDNRKCVRYKRYVVSKLDGFARRD